jgi:hypothetical protein
MAIQQLIHEAQASTEALLDDLGRGAGAREAALAKTKLEEAELWLTRSQQVREEALRAAIEQIPPAATSD